MDISFLVSRTRKLETTAAAAILERISALSGSAPPAPCPANAALLAAGSQRAREADSVEEPAKRLYLTPDLLMSPLVSLPTAPVFAAPVFAPPLPTVPAPLPRAPPASNRASTSTPHDHHGHLSAPAPTPRPADPTSFIIRPPTSLDDPPAFRQWRTTCPSAVQPPSAPHAPPLPAPTPSAVIRHRQDAPDDNPCPTLPMPLVSAASIRSSAASALGPRQQFGHPGTLPHIPPVDPPMLPTPDAPAILRLAHSRLQASAATNRTRWRFTQGHDIPACVTRADEIEFCKHEAWFAAEASVGAKFEEARMSENDYFE
ncbi:hypothetical protein C8F04DRAFT_1268052 [Mycena alexandri]|uniref:Uncharacterized protein n=1 Tax=Mycena alexandri TaxID=1745969 RepID=A0AAD6SGI3_9AGAR|nr:hypothetical protein C8F04DRAFT_1268052 [Mycena alexandri]